MNFLLLFWSSGSSVHSSQEFWAFGVLHLTHLLILFQWARKAGRQATQLAEWKSSCLEDEPVVLTARRWICTSCLSLSAELINPDAAVRTGHLPHLFLFHSCNTRTCTLTDTHDSSQTLYCSSTHGRRGSSPRRRWGQTDVKAKSVSADEKKLVPFAEMCRLPRPRKHTQRCVEEVSRVWLLITLCKSSRVAGLGR